MRILVQPEQLRQNARALRQGYIVRLYTEPGFSDGTNFYTLRVTYP
jgi:hypothetical protein